MDQDIQLTFTAWIWVVDGLKLFTESTLEVLEREHYHSDVVKSLVWNGCFHHLLNYVATNLMDGLLFGMEVLLGCNPRLLENFSVADLVKDAIA